MPTAGPLMLDESSDWSVSKLFDAGWVGSIFVVSATFGLGLENFP